MPGEGDGAVTGTTAVEIRDRRRKAPPTSAPRIPCARRLTAGLVMDRGVITVRHDATLWTAWGLLYAAGDRHLVVVDFHRRPLGVLDERAITRAWPHGPVGPHRERVYGLTRGRPTPCASPDQDMATVARTMLHAGVDAIPVVDESGGLLGLVTTQHLAELVAECV